MMLFPLTAQTKPKESPAIIIHIFNGRVKNNSLATIIKSVREWGGWN